MNTHIQTRTKRTDITVPKILRAVVSRELPRALVADTKAVFGKTKEYLERSWVSGLRWGSKEKLMGDAGKDLPSHIKFDVVFWMIG